MRFYGDGLHFKRIKWKTRMKDCEIQKMQAIYRKYVQIGLEFGFKLQFKLFFGIFNQFNHKITIFFKFKLQISH